jgi:hypothetical protein
VKKLIPAFLLSTLLFTHPIASLSQETEEVPKESLWNKVKGAFANAKESADEAIASPAEESAPAIVTDETAQPVVVPQKVERETTVWERINNLEEQLAVKTATLAETKVELQAEKDMVASLEEEITRILSCVGITTPVK